MKRLYRPELRDIPLTPHSCNYYGDDGECLYATLNTKHTYCIGALLDDEIPCPNGTRFAV